jgi:hypothetical protein
MANHASAKAARHCYSQVNSPVPFARDIRALKSVRGANRPSGAVKDSHSTAEKTKVPVRNREPRSAKDRVSPTHLKAKQIEASSQPSRLAS